MSRETGFPVPVMAVVDLISKRRLALNSTRYEICFQLLTVVGMLKMRDMKLRDMKMWHQNARVENARHEFSAPDCRGGECET